MAKKADEAEVKKECPSCGLGVALDSTICEFCGWDFEEEDEWILQIEKLERDLLLEKQKFEPGSVEEKIQTTLHSPAEEMKAIKSAEPASEEPPARPSVPKRAPPVTRISRPAPAPSPAKPKPAQAERKAGTTTRVRRVRTVKTSKASETPGGLVTRAPHSESKESEESRGTPSKGATRKVRLVRKVK